MTSRQWTCVVLTCVAILLAARANDSAQPAPTALNGEWQATVARQHLALTIEQGTDGVLKGTLVAVDQGNLAVPIDALTLAADGAVRMDMKSIGASFDGKLTADRSTFTGE